MTHPESYQHVIYLRPFIFYTLNLPHEFLVVKVDISNVKWNFYSWGIVTVTVLANYHIFETHVVSRQSSRFIWKYMLNLTQLLVKSTCLHLHLRWGSSLKETVADVHSLKVFHHFKSNDQWNRHEISKKQYPASPLDK
jgi:hypothetical protein